MADGVGEERHSKVDDLDAHGCGHRGDQKQPQQGSLHELGLHTLQRK